ncbi:uncharacterized protein G2W53_024976 [Senna tora]|uniref:Uncharacterized protein n=1 Tax=Senna tora TaxID=362788 RepID=A0A834TE40_9FABA|nr:uncharacterized protein G2W53_024976 [Senna tora]
MAEQFHELCAAVVPSLVGYVANN